MYKKEISSSWKFVRGHPTVQLPARAGLSCPQGSGHDLGCMQRAARALLRQVVHSEHVSFSSKQQLDPGSTPSRPPTPWSQEQGCPRDLGLILVPVNLQIVLYWALLMCKAEMVAFYCLRRAGRTNIQWRHQSTTTPPIPCKVSSTDALICVCFAQNPLQSIDN